MNPKSLRLALAGVALACSWVVAAQPLPDAPEAAPAKPQVNPPPPAVAPPVTPLTEAIRERVDHLRYVHEHDAHDHSIRGANIVVGEGVARLYETEQFQPRWLDASRLDELIAAVGDLRYDGLDPADYHIDALISFRTDLRAGALAPGDQADLELVATDAMMLALYHLYVGKVDPVKLSSQWNYSTRPFDPKVGFEQFRRALASASIADTFQAARPQHVWYQRGRERLKEYIGLAAAGGWSPVPDGPTLEPGAEDPRVPALRQRLRVTRDYDGAPDPYPPSSLYDPALETAVRHFQERHGLTADGVIGPATRAALNVPVSARIDQIRINLERARWVMHEIKGEFVLVNVAGFEVAYFRDDEPIWSSRVIVGKPYRETPIFRSLITYVVLNPTWTIPPTILVKDKLPVIKRDPGYLKRNNIRVIDSSGREVNPYSVNWSRYGAGNLPPYQLRQDPGEDNALGLVKIMFPNPHMVYLHDTPTKSLFDKDERTFSSGCIRVQKAFELAELVLNDPARWNRPAMDAVVATKKMQTVNLAKPVPVLILYWTAQPRADGQVIFRNDVYGRDPATLAALDSDFRLPR
ncbi:MAG: murein L,D-transpeptidase [Lysobacterales bacterium]|nr:MAG: murein L,D-transpeptidase [Xanthomonadales bacterium]